MSPSFLQPDFDYSTFQFFVARISVSPFFLTAVEWENVPWYATWKPHFHWMPSSWSQKMIKLLVHIRLYDCYTIANPCNFRDPKDGYCIKMIRCRSLRQLSLLTTTCIKKWKYYNIIQSWSIKFISICLIQHRCNTCTYFNTMHNGVQHSDDRLRNKTITNIGPYHLLPCPCNVQTSILHSKLNSPRKQYSWWHDHFLRARNHTYNYDDTLHLRTKFQLFTTYTTLSLNGTLLNHTGKLERP